MIFLSLYIDVKLELDRWIDIEQKYQETYFTTVIFFQCLPYGLKRIEFGADLDASQVYRKILLC